MTMLRLFLVRNSKITLNFELPPSNNINFICLLNRINIIICPTFSISINQTTCGVMTMSYLCSGRFNYKIWLNQTVIAKIQQKAFFFIKNSPSLISIRFWSLMDNIICFHLSNYPKYSLFLHLKPKTRMKFLFSKNRAKEQRKYKTPHSITIKNISIMH
jgi:hypothetical protein